MRCKSKAGTLCHSHTRIRHLQATLHSAAVKGRLLVWDEPSWPEWNVYGDSHTKGDRIAHVEGCLVVVCSAIRAPGYLCDTVARTNLGSHQLRGARLQQVTRTKMKIELTTKATATVRQSLLQGFLESRFQTACSLECTLKRNRPYMRQKKSSETNCKTRPAKKIW